MSARDSSGQRKMSIDDLAQMQDRGDDREHNMVMFIREVRDDICALLEPVHDLHIAIKFPTPSSDARIPLQELDAKLHDLIRKVNR